MAYEKIYNLFNKPGTQRDGTPSDSALYSDTVWCRYQRGRPKKMGGYRQITNKINGPARGTHVWSRQALNIISTFSSYGVESASVDSNGVGAALYNRTPAAFTIDPNSLWQFVTMYDSAVGSTKTILIAHNGSNLANIDSGITSDLYYTDVNDPTAALVPMGLATQVSGGIVAIPPYLVIYGSDGFVNWSDVNLPRSMTTGDAGSARITGSKIVKGLPVRGLGIAPSALLWSLDSVIRMSYIGGTAIFRFDILSAQSSILSSSSVIEYDGNFYWIGIDRFMQYNSTVQELTNFQSVNWFFDNLNYAQRQKVHAVKVPRYGEIWWFYPRGNATECTDAVIYNVRENLWYDAILPRSSGVNPQVFHFPIMADSTSTGSYRLTLSNVNGIFSIGDLVTGTTSKSTGYVSKLMINDVYVTIINKPAWSTGENLTNSTSGATATLFIPAVLIPLTNLWVHETGTDISQGDNITAIPSSFSLSDIGWLSGGPANDTPVGDDRWLRIKRMEPDFVQVGGMSMTVIGQETPNSSEVVSQQYPFTPTTERVDMREMQRVLTLRFTSDIIGGDYEMGRVRILAELGDVRS
jgi:hypothetical protein